MSSLLAGGARGAARHQFAIRNFNKLLKCEFLAAIASLTSDVMQCPPATMAALHASIRAADWPPGGSVRNRSTRWTA